MFLSVTGWGDENHGNHKIRVNSCILLLLSVTGWGDENHGNHKISVNCCILVLLSVTGWDDENRGNHEISANQCILVLLSVAGWGNENRGNHKISSNANHYVNHENHGFSGCSRVGSNLKRLVLAWDCISSFFLMMIIPRNLVLK